MTFYGLLSAQTQKVIELLGSRAEAEAELASVLADEPAFADILSVVEVELGGESSHN